MCSLVGCRDSAFAQMQRKRNNNSSVERWQENTLRGCGDAAVVQSCTEEGHGSVERLQRKQRRSSMEGEAVDATGSRK
jgi:hypothetical protein